MGRGSPKPAAEAAGRRLAVSEERTRPEVAFHLESTASLPTMIDSVAAFRLSPAARADWGSVTALLLLVRSELPPSQGDAQQDSGALAPSGLDFQFAAHHRSPLAHSHHAQTIMPGR